MNLFWTVNRILVGEIEAYVRLSGELMSRFSESLTIWLDKGPTAEYEKAVESIHDNEHQADLKLKLIENMLYEKSLLPEAREDLLVLLEKADDIIDQANAAAKNIFLVNLPPSQIIRDDILSLGRVCCQAQAAAGLALQRLFNGKGELRQACAEINRLEHEADQIEHTLIRKVFTSDIPPAERILYRDLAVEMGNITDFADDVADKLILIDIKRVI